MLEGRHTVFGSCRAQPYNLSFTFIRVTISLACLIFDNVEFSDASWEYEM